MQNSYTPLRTIQVIKHEYVTFRANLESPKTSLEQSFAVFLTKYFGTFNFGAWPFVIFARTLNCISSIIVARLNSSNHHTSFAFWKLPSNSAISSARNVYYKDSCHLISIPNQLEKWRPIQSLIMPTLHHCARLHYACFSFIRAFLAASIHSGFTSVTFPALLGCELLQFTVLQHGINLGGWRGWHGGARGDFFTLINLELGGKFFLFISKGIYASSWWLFK